MENYYAEDIQNYFEESKNFFIERIFPHLDEFHTFYYLKSQHKYFDYNITIPNYDKIKFYLIITFPLEVARKILDHLEFQTFQETYIVDTVINEIESTIEESSLKLLVDEMVKLTNNSKHIRSFRGFFMPFQASTSYYINNDFKTYSTPRYYFDNHTWGTSYDYDNNYYNNSDTETD